MPRPEVMPRVYLAETPFDAATPYYSVFVGEADALYSGSQAGCIVMSECCSDRMSVDTARVLHAALGAYLAAAERGPADV